MKLADIKGVTSKNATLIKVIIAMVVMLYFGYYIAGFQHQAQQDEIRRANQTLAMLNSDNNALTTAKNQLTMKLDIATMKADKLAQRLAEANDKVRALEKEKAFYTRVMAPEETQDGFLIEGLQITDAASPGFYHANLVVLQQRQVKAVVRGTLTIRVSGSLNGKPEQITLGPNSNINPDQVEYGFKYFQPVSFLFSLPADFVPESLVISTTVFQYKRKRGDYQRAFSWQEVYENGSVAISAE